MKRGPSILVLLFVLLLSPPQTALADYQIPQSVVAGGGGLSVATGYRLTGTVSQPMIGRSAATGYVHGIGFWHQAQVFFADVSEEAPALPVRFSLGSTYPNPGGPVTHLRFAVPRAARVALRLYDVTGRQVRTLLEGEMPPGFHTIRLDGTELPAGVYYCLMTAPGFRETRSLVLVK